MFSVLTPRKHTHSEALGSGSTVSLPSSLLNTDGQSNEDDARGLKTKAILQSAERSARWRRRLLILWLYFVLGLASYSLAASAGRNLAFASALEALNLDALTASTRIFFSQEKSSASKTSVEKAAAKNFQRLGCKIDDIHWQESDDGTLFVLDQWVLDTIHRVAFMIPAPNIAAASGHITTAKQSPLRDAAAPGRKGGVALRCAFDDLDRGAEGTGALQTTVEVVGQQFVLEWEAAKNEKKVHDPFTVLLLCDVPPVVWEHYQAEKSLPVALIDTARGGDYEKQKIGLFEPCIMHAPERSARQKFGFCGSPTQQTASMHAGRRAAEFMEYHSMIGVDHFFLYVDYATEKTKAALQPYATESSLKSSDSTEAAPVATVINWIDAVDRSLDSLSMTESNEASAAAHKALGHDHVWFSQTMPFMRLQATAHRHCQWKFGPYFDWMMFHDLDEYIQIVDPKKSKLDDVLAPYEEEDNVCALNLHGPHYDTSKAGLPPESPLAEQCRWRSDGGIKDTKTGSKAKWIARGAHKGPLGGSMYTVAGVHGAMICGNETIKFGKEGGTTMGLVPLKPPNAWLVVENATFSPLGVRYNHCRYKLPAGDANVEDPGFEKYVPDLKTRLQKRGII